MALSRLSPHPSSRRRSTGKRRQKGRANGASRPRPSPRSSHTQAGTSVRRWRPLRSSPRPPGPCDATWSGDFEFAADYTVLPHLINEHHVPRIPPLPPPPTHKFPAEAQGVPSDVSDANEEEGEWEGCNVGYDDVPLSPLVACTPDPSSSLSPIFPSSPSPISPSHIDHEFEDAQDDKQGKWTFPPSPLPALPAHGGHRGDASEGQGPANPHPPLALVLLHALLRALPARNTQRKVPEDVQLRAALLPIFLCLQVPEDEAARDECCHPLLLRLPEAKGAEEQETLNSRGRAHRWAARGTECARVRSPGRVLRPLAGRVLCDPAHPLAVLGGSEDAHDTVFGWGAVRGLPLPHVSVGGARAGVRHPMITGAEGEYGECKEQVELLVLSHVVAFVLLCGEWMWGQRVRGKRVWE
ncbi:hypothetical protein DFH07DRAFT_777788 [Mycena maculata]|uniref:Uncharacterized protein n=1 Tax=Mycena maculata TaxID=230809 RepID=A0AAD7IFT6_9AGAR|nr:hypothetical protein DFH07DRAFT_777788 [Mycena maculata]